MHNPVFLSSAFISSESLDAVFATCSSHPEAVQRATCYESPPAGHSLTILILEYGGVVQECQRLTSLSLSDLWPVPK